MQSAVGEPRNQGPKRKAASGQQSLLVNKRKCVTSTYYPPPKASPGVTTITTSNGERIELVDEPAEEKYPEQGYSEDSLLLPCRVRRNYACKSCNYTTTNPRLFLYHQRDAHGQKGSIHECAYCVYASVHSHKLLRHISLVHRAAAEAANEQPHHPQTGYLSLPPALSAASPAAMTTAPSAFSQLSADGVPLPPDLEVILVEDDSSPSTSEKTVRPMLMEPSVVLLPLSSQPALPPLHRQKVQPRHIRPAAQLMLPPPPLLSAARSGTAGRSLVKPQQPQRRPAAEVKGKPTEEFSCSACSFKSKSKVLVQRHEKVSHLKKKFFRCTKCNYVTSVRARYTKHVRYHDMPYIKCETCDFSTPYKWNLDRHRRNHLEEGSAPEGGAPDGMEVFKCYKCTFSTLSKQSLSVHLLNHHAEGGGYRRPRRMDENANNSNPVSPESPGQGQEQQPPPYLHDQTLEDELGEDVDEDEDENEDVDEDEDENEDVDEDEDENEDEDKNEDEDEDEDEDEENEEENGAEVADVEEIDEDEEEANNDSAAKPYACVECRETFPSVSLLDRHAYEFHEIEHPRRPPMRKRTVVKRLDGKPKVKCDLCPYEAKWISEVVRHRRVHIQDKPYACPHCEFRSRWKGDMTRHIIKYHGGDGDSTFEGDPPLKVEEEKPKDAEVNNFEQLLDQTMMVGGEEDLQLFNPSSSAASPAPEQDLPLDLSRALEGDMVLSPAKGGMSPFCAAGKEGGTGLLPFLLRIPPRRIPTQEIRSPIHLTPSLQLIPTSTPSATRVPRGKMASPNMRNPRTLSISPAMVSNESPSTPLTTVHSNVPAAALSEKLDKNANAPIIRKTFQCPYCSYSTTTASRFHMHIVVHLNQKPYMCSECGYRSNWQWDITKHSKMKAHRDPRHASASVIVVNDVGNKNYEKYEKYAVYETLIAKPKTKSEQFCSSISPMVEGSSVGRATLSLPTSLPSVAPALSRPAALKSKMTKKISFKCKYCEFRHNVRRNIIRHMSVHSGNKPFWCGICGQSSNCRNVILRHCHVRHGVSGPIMQRDGDKSTNIVLPSPPGVNGELGFEIEEEEVEELIKQSAAAAPPIEEPPPKSPEVIEEKVPSPPVESLKLTKTAIEFQEDKSKRQKCPICPYRCRKLFDLRIHSYMHKPHEGANFKCMFCPFYVSLKRSWFQHMKLHVDQPHEYVKQCLEGVVPSFLPSAELKPMEEKNSPPQEMTPAKIPTLPVVTSPKPKIKRQKFKRYRCEQCPYRTETHTTFLYHRQFHRPGRTGVFKCTSCTYAVSKYHLLLQHVRLHEIATVTEANEAHSSEVPLPTSTSSNKPHPVPMPPPDSSTPLATLENPPQASAVCRVWVQRDGVFKKMFKCPHCPHISLKRTVITDHEKMHFNRKSTLGKATFMCNQCNYTCRNSGALTAHQRMHQEHENSVGYISEKDYAMSKASAKPKSPKSASPVKERPKPLSLLDFNIDVEEKWTRLSDPGKQFFNCGKCPAKFTKPQQMVFHRALHGAGYKWKCSSCDYTARHRPHLHKHSKVHTQEYLSEYVIDTSNRVSSRRRTSGIFHFNKNNTVGIDSSPKTLVIASVPPSNPSDSTPPAIQARKGTHSPAKVLTLLPKAVVSTNGKPIPKKNYSCNLCPSVFFKYSTLVYHLHLHGSQSKYKCPHCTYAVANICNLVRHSKVHNPDVQPAKNKTETTGASQDFSSSSEKPSGRCQMPMHLSCPKCPAVFDKKLRYEIHVALHGSKQRFKCDRCDYAVQFAANMVRHRRMHAEAERKAAQHAGSLANGLMAPPATNNKGNASLEASTSTSAAATSYSESKAVSDLLEETLKSIGTTNITPVEKQHLLLQRLQNLHSSKSSLSVAKDETTASVSEPKKLFRCERCPYSNHRKDAVQSHMRRHIILPAFESTCPHCDYGSGLTSFLKEHIKLHFKPFRFHQVDAFVEWEEFEIWAKFGNTKRLIYRHSVDGKEFTEEDVFEVSTKTGSISGDEEIENMDQDNEGVIDGMHTPENSDCKDPSEAGESKQLSEGESNSNDVQGVVKSLMDKVENLNDDKCGEKNDNDAESVVPTEEKKIGDPGERKKSQKRTNSPKTRQSKNDVIKEKGVKVTSAENGLQNDQNKDAVGASHDKNNDIVKPIINGDNSLTNTAEYKSVEKNARKAVKEKPPSIGGSVEVHNPEDSKGISEHVSKEL